MRQRTGKNMLERFRRQTGRQKSWREPLSTKDYTAVISVFIASVSSLWMLGGVFLSGLITQTALSLLAFSLIFWNPSTRGNNSRPLARLFNYPVFWTGLLLLLYVVFQGLNHSWLYVSGDAAWYLRELNPIPWLPSGFDSPITLNSPWRVLLIWTGPWLCACALWVGLEKRRAARLFIWLHLGNVVLWCVIGLMQYASKATSILGLYEPVDLSATPAPFFSTLINLNHAAAYLNLGLTAALSLYQYYQTEARRKLRSDGPHLLMLVIAALLITCIFITGSRAGYLVCILIVLFFIILQMGALRNWPIGRTIAGGLILLALTGMDIASLSNYVDFNRLQREFDSLQNVASNPDTDLRFRVFEVSWEMFQDKPVFGWGAGSYELFFRIYQARYPELDLRRKAWQQDSPGGERSLVPVKVIFDHPHNDPLLFMVEMGWIGTGILVTGIIWTGIFFLKNLRGLNVASIMLLVGLGFSFLHSLVGKYYYFPALLSYFSVLFTYLTWSVRRAVARE